VLTTDHFSQPSLCILTFSLRKLRSALIELAAYLRGIRASPSNLRDRYITPPTTRQIGRLARREIAEFIAIPEKAFFWTTRAKDEPSAISRRTTTHEEVSCQEERGEVGPPQRF